MLKAIAEDQDCVETIVEGGSRSKCIAGGGVEGCVRSQGHNCLGAGCKGRVEAEGCCIRVEGESLKDAVDVVPFVAC